MLTTKNSGALVSGPARRNSKAEDMSEQTIKLRDGRITSKGPVAAGESVSLPESEAALFLRKKWAFAAPAKKRRQPVVFDEPAIENREKDVDKTISKRKK